MDIYNLYLVYVDILLAKTKKEATYAVLCCARDKKAAQKMAYIDWYMHNQYFISKFDIFDMNNFFSTCVVDPECIGAIDTLYMMFEQFIKTYNKRGILFEGAYDFNNFDFSGLVFND